MRIPGVSPRRLFALCRKESFQIVRDPSSILIAFVLPVILLFLYGFGINLDMDHVPVAVLRLDDGPAAVRFEQALSGSPAFAVHRVGSRAELMGELGRGDARGAVVIPNDFSARVLQGRGGALQVLTDGAEPNTANFVSSYVQGAFDRWRGGGGAGPEVRQRAWFNPDTVSRNFLVPGSIAVVMTIIGALLTSLVVAREWERGTMEALLATPVTKAELLLSKIIPYYVLGMAAMALCTAVAVFLLGVPFNGSILALGGITTLFLGCALGFGLFLSTVLPTQFNAAQASLVAGFLPAMMLSGFVFEISSMPVVLRAITRIVPARYFTRALSTLFQAGTLPEVLVPNALALAALTVFWLGITARKTRRTLD
ncbi:ABC transporter permease [Mesoterricola sediminis]|uniref:Membrane protein n=1 Tax=Mesoterricola sediminis TaxID=2927980 RepID=A0AA48GRR5_9BACT|nr:ABC transporter permease [Mesoterricola sediminis]BDU78056.1 membrane protein [Mesoterricola sediminis]